MGLGKGVIRLSILVGVLSCLLSVICFALFQPLRPTPPPDPTYEPPVPIEELTEWHLRLLPWEHLIQIFYLLPAPSEALEGEYMAQMLDTSSLLMRVVAAVSFNPLWPGLWVGKAFVSGEGWGYNIFLWSFPQVRGSRRFKMEVGFAPSVFDGKPMFQLEYKRQNHALARVQMRDEVREIRPGLYLGVGTMGRTAAKRLEPMPFYLHGPFSPPMPHLYSDEVLHTHLPAEGLLLHATNE